MPYNDEPRCLDCDDEGCENCEPEDALKAREDAARRAESAMQELVSMFAGLSEASVLELAKQVAVNITKTLEGVLRDKLKDLVMRECGTAVKKLAAEHMKEVFAEVLVGQIVVNGESWDQQKKSVAEIIRKEMTDAVGKLKNENIKNNLVQETINSFLSKELKELAEQAVRQFKTETVAQLKRESMSALTQAIAKTIAGDKKLIALLDAQ